MFGWNNPVSGAGRPLFSHQRYDDPVLLGAGCGLVEGTPVATQDGWQPVEALRSGDQVLTFDGGAQEVVAVVRDVMWAGEGRCPRRLWPVRVPANMIGNREEILVMPHQGVLIETDGVSDIWGDPYAVVPGAALQVLDGVTAVEPSGAVEVVLPVFAEDQMVFADHGALMFCQSHWGLSVGFVPRHGAPQNYNLLPLAIAARLLEESFTPEGMEAARA